MAKNTVYIENDTNKYPFRLHCDDIAGYIRLFSNRRSNAITDRNAPITLAEKWGFHNDRTGYYEKGEGPFVGSYLLKSQSPRTYHKWMEFIRKRYKELKGQKED